MQTLSWMPPRSTPLRKAPNVRLIGLDPGLNHTGWGILETSGNRLIGIAAGIVSPPKHDNLAVRLAALFSGLERVLETYKPDAAAVEETFVNANPKAALVLGQARGVVLLAPARFGLVVTPYSANTVKKTVTGSGHAGKDQVAAMVRLLVPNLANSLDVTKDAADALAVAICHAQHSGTASVWNRAQQKISATH